MPESHLRQNRIVTLHEIDERLQRYRLVQPKLERQMPQSLKDCVHQWDPRMSAAGNRIAKRLALLLDCLARMNSWLKYKGRAELQAINRDPLTTGFVKLEQETKLVAEAVADFLKDLKLP